MVCSPPTYNYAKHNIKSGTIVLLFEVLLLVFPINKIKT